MSRLDTLSQQAIAETLARESAEDYITLIELTVPGVTGGPLRFTNKAVQRLNDASGNELQDEYGAPVYGVVSRGLTYSYLPFELPDPTSEPGQAPKSTIEVSNCNRVLMPYIDQINGPSDLRIIQIHTTNLNLIQAEYTGLKLGSFEFQDEAISGDLSVDLLTNTAYPAHSYTSDRYPGMS